MKLRMTIGRKIQMCVIAMILLSVGLVIGMTFPKFEDTMADATKNHLMDQVTVEAQVVEKIEETYGMVKENSALSKNLKKIVEKYIL